jgi:hypothetical protein
MILNFLLLIYVEWRLNQLTKLTSIFQVHTYHNSAVLLLNLISEKTKFSQKNKVFTKKQFSQKNTTDL